MEKDKLESLVSSKLSTYKIANNLGVSNTTIRYWLKKYGLKTKFKSRNEISIIDGKRQCTSCENYKELEEFYKNGKKYHTYCKSCLTKITLTRQRKIKILAIDYKGGQCQRCGYNKYVGALDFHHLNPLIKDDNWNNFKNRKFDSRFKLELDKCELLCANCHREIHAEINGTIAEGFSTGVKSQGRYIDRN